MLNGIKQIEIKRIDLREIGGGVKCTGPDDGLDLENDRKQGAEHNAYIVLLQNSVVCCAFCWSGDAEKRSGLWGVVWAREKRWVLDMMSARCLCHILMECHVRS